MSSRHNIFTLAALPAFALAACATTANYRVEAKVRSLHSGARDASGITAVAGADVALQCPDNSANRPLGKTDGDGSLKVDGDGAIPLTCSVAISEPGYHPVALAVADVCTEKVLGACRTLDVRAILTSDTTATR